MNPIDTIELHSNGLFSKHGFMDGDLLDDVPGLPHEFFMLPHSAAHHLDEKHETLARLVERYLVPAMPILVKTVRIGTHHNPIRAEDWASATPNTIVLVRHADVLAVAQEVLDERGIDLRITPR